MSRSVDEWVGQSDDTRIPPRVELRVFLAGGGRCAHCTVKLHRRKDWHLDHQIALINGGENRESNLQIVCTGCHKDKTRTDVAAKAKAVRVRLRYAGIKGATRLIPGSKGSGWRRPINGRAYRVVE